MAVNIYRNGNYIVSIDNADGTKKRILFDDSDSADFIPEFPESMDINLTQKCNGGCPFCYAECTSDGPHGDIMGAKFIDTLRPYTEVALQVNDLSHPDLLPFLKKLKTLKVFPSITVNQKHFEQKEELIAELVQNQLIYGLGVSLQDPTPFFLDKAGQYSNLVVHVINGIVTPQDICRMASSNLKILILGYKDKGRGHDYLIKEEEKIKRNQNWLKNNLNVIIKAGFFKVVSFDNLALEQLEVRKLFSSSDEWDKFYMGNDGAFTFYVDLVNKTFGRSSLVPKEEMMPLRDDVVEMFDIIREINS